MCTIYFKKTLYHTIYTNTYYLYINWNESINKLLLLTLCIIKVVSSIHTFHAQYTNNIPFLISFISGYSDSNVKSLVQNGMDKDLL